MKNISFKLQMPLALILISHAVEAQVSEEVYFLFVTVKMKWTHHV